MRWIASSLNAPLRKRFAFVAGNDGFEAFRSKRMTAAVCRSAIARISIRAREAWPEVAVATIRRDLRALTKGITDKAEENDDTDGCKNPIGHDPILRLGNNLIVSQQGFTLLTSRDRNSRQILL